MTELRVAAVLFDMDGTLVDSTAMVEAVWTEFAEENGVDAAGVIEFAHGRPSRDTIARFAADPARVDEWLEWIHTAEGERFTDVTAIPGALEVVGELEVVSELEVVGELEVVSKPSAGRWAVVTSALHGPALERLAQNGFPVPAVLIGADDVAHGKPSPEGFLAAAVALGVDPSECVVFEDTAAGIEAGLRAGCAVVAVGGVEASGLTGRVADFTQVTVSAAGTSLRLTFP